MRLSTTQVAVLVKVATLVAIVIGTTVAITDSAVGHRWGAPDDVPARVDTTLIRVAGLTGHEHADTVALHVTSASMDAPFQWTLTVTSTGRVLFSDTSDDTGIDKNFGREPAFGTGGRIEAKRRYYFQGLLAAAVQFVKIPEQNSMFDQGSAGSVYSVVPRALRARGVTDSGVIANAVTRVATRLKAGTMVLSIPTSPVQSEPPRIYVAQPVSAFIVFYKW